MSYIFMILMEFLSHVQATFGLSPYPLLAFIFSLHLLQLFIFILQKYPKADFYKLYCSQVCRTFVHKYQFGIHGPQENIRGQHFQLVYVYSNQFFFYYSLFIVLVCHQHDIHLNCVFYFAGVIITDSFFDKELQHRQSESISPMTKGIRI